MESNTDFNSLLKYSRVLFLIFIILAGKPIQSVATTIKRLTEKSLITSLEIVDSTKYPIGYFHMPVPIPIKLSATFAEFRGDHFHSGIDISTNGKTGIRVLAAADGFVSRIKVQAGGYGQALYITHPNGYVSVYGHLEAYAGPIAAWIKEIQYKNHTYEIDIYPKPGELPVKQGMLIAFSGNTGYSGGPHLHFEIRDEKTEEIINPLLFGLPVADHKAPRIKSITIFSINPKNGVDEINPIGTYSARIGTLKQTEKTASSTYLLERKVQTNLPKTFILGINCDDIQDASPNRRGIYKIKLFKEGLIIYESVFERFAFDQTRSLNSYLDYPLSRRKIMIQRSYREPGNNVSLYRKVVDNGIITQKDAKPMEFIYEISDAAGNVSTIKFKLLGNNTPAINSIIPSAAVSSTNVTMVKINEGIVLGFNTSGKISYGKEAELELHFPAHCLFANLIISAKKQDGFWQIGNPDSAIKDSILACFSSKAIDTKKKWIISHLDGNPLRTFIQDGKLCAWIKDFGAYNLYIDSIPPLLKVIELPRGELKSMIRVIAKDPGSGIKKYEGLIDGIWVMFRYDQKNDLLWYPFDKIILPGKHHFQLHVSDKAGNDAMLESSFNFNTN